MFCAGKASSHPAYRNLAATQVIRVPGSVYDRFGSKQEATDAFDLAMSKGEVETISQ
jgi:hypothetical protein